MISVASTLFIARFRDGNNSLGPDACKDIAGYVVALLDKITNGSMGGVVVKEHGQIVILCDTAAAVTHFGAS